jgi:arylsulfate sulfotransferase
VYGDVVIDLGDMENVGGNNPNHTPEPTWAWNEFNHLDINRRPYNYPDWTHTNAVIYSSDDGNLIISMRHQNWLVKIDYANGMGAGDIIWHLGYQGDFTLMNAEGTPDTDPTDWFFAQHGPSFVSNNTTGKFSLVLFDNGDDRGVAVVAGGTCGVTGQPACYSTVPLFNLDETAMTATFVINPKTEDYSFFGGNAEVLANGDVEYDECSDPSQPATSGAILEVTQSSSAQTVWKMQIADQYAYRGMRMGSLYPGVQW